MIFTKKQLIDALEHLDDNDFVMVTVGKRSYPINEVDDSTMIGFWELKCLPETDYMEELTEARSKGQI